MVVLYCLEVGVEPVRWKGMHSKNSLKEVSNSWGVLWLHVGVCVLFFVFSFFVRRVACGVLGCVWLKRYQ